MSTTEKKKKKESPIVNLALNIAVPFLILTNDRIQELTGPVNGLIIAILFPLGYGLYDFIKTKSVNFISVLGLISILLTGVFGLMKLPAEWIAIKEASVPFIIGAIIIITSTSKNPLIKKLLFNEQFMKIELLESRLEERNAKSSFDVLLKKSSYWIALSFLLSAILNFALAKYLLVSEPGTTEYNAEIGRMNALSFPVIAIPCTLIMVAVFWNILKKIQILTGLSFEEVVNK